MRRRWPEFPVVSTPCPRFGEHVSRLQPARLGNAARAHRGDADAIGDRFNAYAEQPRRRRGWRELRGGQAEHGGGQAGGKITAVGFVIPGQERRNAFDSQALKLMRHAVAMRNVFAAHDTDHQSIRYARGSGSERLRHCAVPYELGLDEAVEFGVGARRGGGPVLRVLYVGVE